MKFNLQTIEIKNENSKTAVVLLHGYGANRHDLAPLAEVLGSQLSPKILPSFYFPDGPSTPRELAAFGGKAWFNLDMSLLQSRAANPEADLYDDAHVEKLYRASDAHLAPFLETVSKNYEKIVLGGFSQGAMLCADWAWRHYKPYVKALILYSPAWPYLKTPETCALPDNLPVFVSHGKQDPVLSIKHNIKLRENFLSKNAFVVESIFNGSHEIPHSALNDSKKFLDEILKA